MPELEARLDAVIRRSQHLERVFHRRFETQSRYYGGDETGTVTNAIQNPLQHTLYFNAESPKVVTRAT